MDSRAAPAQPPATKQGDGSLAVAGVMTWSRDQVDLLKRTVCKGATDDELAMFGHVAKRLGLDPFARQVHAVKRWDSSQKREVMAIQVGIDGFRLVADRTGKYAPGREPTYAYDQAGKVTAATAYIKKLVAGEWHEIAATAHFSEYVGLTKEGKPNRMWADKPHIMLAKCAEALALRRAFPAELSGVHSEEELEAVGLQEKRTVAMPKRRSELQVKDAEVQAPAPVDPPQAIDEPPAAPPATAPAAEPEKPPTFGKGPQGMWVEDKIAEVRVSKETGRFGVRIGGDWYGTTDKAIRESLENAHGFGERIRIVFKNRTEGKAVLRDILMLVNAEEDEPGAEA